MLTIILLIYLSVAVVSYYLEFLNIRQVKRYGHIVPREFAGSVDDGVLKKTRDYTLEQSRLSLVHSIFNDLVVILFFFGGLISIYNAWIVSLDLPFIISGTLFFLFLVYTKTLLSLPFDLYSTFGIENKYGFNTMTGKLWVSDLLKAIILTTILVSSASLSVFFLIRLRPDSWWFLVWLFSLLFSLFILYISPYVIEPLFNKITPLKDMALEGSIKDLMKKAGIVVSRVFQIDASKRSRHSNAYFTGIGKVKRIVLYDTLLQKLDKDEVLSVLAHEAGHWKKRHILKRIVLIEAFSFIGLYIAFKIIRTGYLSSLFHIQSDTLFVKLLILGFIWGIVSFPLTPLMSYLSRRHEKEADVFAAELTGNPEAMARSLIKLSTDNLSNLHPHPLYASFYYSHPPVVKRVREIRGEAG